MYMHTYIVRTKRINGEALYAAADFQFQLLDPRQCSLADKVIPKIENKNNKSNSVGKFQP